MKRFDLLVAGELNVDLIFNQINKVPQIGEEQRAHEMDIKLGSSTAIFASNSSSLGLKVCFTGKTGNDSYGDIVEASLKSNGVCTDYIIKDSMLKTGATVVLGIGNDRIMVTYPGAMEHFSESEIPDMLFNESRHLHTSSIFFQPGLKKDLVSLLKRAKEYGMTTSMDTQWDPDENWDIELNEIFPYLDFFMPNEKEFLNITGAKNLNEAFETVGNTGCCLIIKKGAAGVILKKNDFVLTAPALHIPDFIDAIGAGDSFNAGFINAFLNGKDLKVCLQLGIQTASASVMAPGGTAGIESFEQVMKKTSGLQPIQTSPTN
jgi:sugar/nucleoside kinase (ribokinase family)